MAHQHHHHPDDILAKWNRQLILRNDDETKNATASLWAVDRATSASSVSVTSPDILESWTGQRFAVRSGDDLLLVFPTLGGGSPTTTHGGTRAAVIMHLDGDGTMEEVDSSTHPLALTLAAHCSPQRRILQVSNASRTSTTDVVCVFSDGSVAFVDLLQKQTAQTLSVGLDMSGSNNSGSSISHSALAMTDHSLMVAFILSNGCGTTNLCVVEASVQQQQQQEGEQPSATNQRQLRTQPVTTMSLGSVSVRCIDVSVTGAAVIAVWPGKVLFAPRGSKSALVMAGDNDPAPGAQEAARSIMKVPTCVCIGSRTNVCLVVDDSSHIRLYAAEEGTSRCLADVAAPIACTMRCHVVNISSAVDEPESGGSATEDFLISTGSLQPPSSSMASSDEVGTQLLVRCRPVAAPNHHHHQEQAMTLEIVPLMDEEGAADDDSDDDNDNEDNVIVSASLTCTPLPMCAATDLLVPTYDDAAGRVRLLPVMFASRGAPFRLGSVSWSMEKPFHTARCLLRFNRSGDRGEVSLELPSPSLSASGPNNSNNNMCIATCVTIAETSVAVEATPQQHPSAVRDSSSSGIGDHSSLQQLGQHHIMRSALIACVGLNHRTRSPSVTTQSPVIALCRLDAEEDGRHRHHDTNSHLVGVLPLHGIARVACVRHASGVAFTLTEDQAKTTTATPGSSAAVAAKSAVSDKVTSNAEFLFACGVGGVVRVPLRLDDGPEEAKESATSRPTRRRLHATDLYAVYNDEPRSFVSLAVHQRCATGPNNSTTTMTTIFAISRDGLCLGLSPELVPLTSILSAASPLVDAQGLSSWIQRSADGSKVATVLKNQPLLALLTFPTPQSVVAQTPSHGAVVWDVLDVTTEGEKSAGRCATFVFLWSIPSCVDHDGPMHLVLVKFEAEPKQVPIPTETAIESGNQSLFGWHVEAQHQMTRRWPVSEVVVAFPRGMAQLIQSRRSEDNSSWSLERFGGELGALLDACPHAVDDDGATANKPRREWWWAPLDEGCSALSPKSLVPHCTTVDVALIDAHV